MNKNKEKEFSVLKCRIQGCTRTSLSCRYCYEHYEQNITKHFQEYFKYMSNKNMRTIDIYTYHLSWIGIDKLNSLKTKEDAHELYLWMTQQDGRQDYSYIKNYRVVYAALMSWLRFKGLYDIINYVQKPINKKNKRVDKMKHHTRDVLLKFVDHVIKNEKNEFKRDRNVLFLSFLIYTGVRVGEAISLKVRDIDFKKGYISISEFGKTGFRKIIIKKDVLILFKEFINKYQLKIWVFDFKPTLNKNRMKIWSQYANTKSKNENFMTRYKLYRQFQKAEYMIKKIGMDLKESKIITPHQFRHSLAMYLRHEKKWHIDEIQPILGHTDIKTTQIYAKTRIEDVEKKFLDDI